MTIVKPKLFYLLFLSLISCSFILAAHLFTSSPTFSLLCRLLISLFASMNLIRCSSLGVMNLCKFCCYADSIRFEDDEKLASEAAETDENASSGNTVFNGFVLIWNFLFFFEWREKFAVIIDSMYWVNLILWLKKQKTTKTVLVLHSNQCALDKSFFVTLDKDNESV